MEGSSISSQPPSGRITKLALRSQPTGAGSSPMSLLTLGCVFNAAATAHKALGAGKQSLQTNHSPLQLWAACPS